MRGNPNKSNKLNNEQPFRTFTLRVNLTHYPEAQFIRGTSLMVPKDHAQTVNETSVVEEKYWYWDEKGAAAYITMTQEEGYDVLARTLELLEDQIIDMREKTFKFFKETHPSCTKESLPPCELVVLGVGSARKENLILKTLIRKYGYPSKREFGPIIYIPVDISFPLLQNSLRSVFADGDLRECIIHGNLKVSPVLTDFLTGLEGFLKNDVCKLIVAQGIVWNAPVPDLFDAFRHLMTPHSLLLIDVEFTGGRSDDQITSNYKGDAAIDFFYHPLGLLHSASQTKERNYFENKWGSRVSYHKAFSGFSFKDGNVNPFIVQRNTFNEFMKEHNLSRKSKSRIRLSPGEKSKTVIILYEPRASNDNSRTIVLGYSTRFEYGEFEAYLNDNGFVPVGKWLDNRNPEKAVFGHYLLRLKTEEESPTAKTKPPWTEEKICQNLRSHNWRVATGNITGGQQFNITAEKKGRFGRTSEILLCDIEKDNLTTETIDDFLNKVSEARTKISKISKAAIFCEINVANDVYSHYEKKRNSIPSLKFYLVRNISDQNSLEKDL